MLKDKIKAIIYSTYHLLEVKIMNIGFIGAGNMGSAVAKAVSDAGHKCLIYDRHPDKTERVATLCKGEIATLEEIQNNASFIFLGIKPQGLEASKGELCPYLKGKIVISMLAGKKICDVKEALGTRVIRIMPNTPVFCNEGVVLYSIGDDISSDEEATFCDFMSKCGMLSRIDEDKIDAATAISGCGPAFVYTFMSAMAEGGVECGIPYETALEYAAQTLIGSAKNLLARKEDPEKLTRDVCSKGGSTIEGVKHLQNNDFNAIVSGAIKASYKRTQELGK